MYFLHLASGCHILGFSSYPTVSSQCWVDLVSSLPSLWECCSALGSVLSPLFSSTHIHSLDDLICSLGYKCKVQFDNSQMGLSSSDLPLEFLTYISNCLFTISAWISNRNLKLCRSQTELRILPLTCSLRHFGILEVHDNSILPSAQVKNLKS